MHIIRKNTKKKKEKKKERKKKTLNILHLLYISFAIDVGGVVQRFPPGVVNQPLEMPGSPNSRGRLSLNLITGPQTKHQNGKKVILSLVFLHWRSIRMILPLVHQR